MKVDEKGRVEVEGKAKTKTMCDCEGLPRGMIALSRKYTFKSFSRNGSIFFKKTVLHITFDLKKVNRQQKLGSHSQPTVLSLEGPWKGSILFASFASTRTKSYRRQTSDKVE